MNVKCWNLFLPLLSMIISCKRPAVQDSYEDSIMVSGGAQGLASGFAFLNFSDLPRCGAYGVKLDFFADSDGDKMLMQGAEKVLSTFSDCHDQTQWKKVANEAEQLNHPNDYGIGMGQAFEVLFEKGPKPESPSDILSYLEANEEAFDYLCAIVTFSEENNYFDDNQSERNSLTPVEYLARAKEKIRSEVQSGELSFPLKVNKAYLRDLARFSISEIDLTVHRFVESELFVLKAPYVYQRAGTMRGNSDIREVEIAGGEIPNEIFELLSTFERLESLRLKRVKYAPNGLLKLLKAKPSLSLKLQPEFARQMRELSKSNE